MIEGYKVIDSDSHLMGISEDSPPSLGFATAEDAASLISGRYASFRLLNTPIATTAAPQSQAL